MSFHAEGMITGAYQTQWICILHIGVERMGDLYSHPKVGQQEDREGGKGVRE